MGERLSYTLARVSWTRPVVVDLDLDSDLCAGNEVLLDGLVDVVPRPGGVAARKIQSHDVSTLAVLGPKVASCRSSVMLGLARRALSAATGRVRPRRRPMLIAGSRWPA